MLIVAFIDLCFIRKCLPLLQQVYQSRQHNVKKMIVALDSHQHHAHTKTQPTTKKKY